MSNAHECPSVDQLQQLALGQLPNPPASSVEHHLLDCDPCAQTTLNLAADGTLVEAMRGAVTNKTPFTNETVGLVSTSPSSGERDRVRGPSVKSAPSPSLSPEDGGEEFRSGGANAPLNMDSPLPERLSQLIQKLRDLPTRELSDADNATVLSGEAGSEAMPEIDWSSSFTPAEAADEIGRLSGFRILKLLGQGGMGGVFLAEDMHLQRRVALKVMRPEFAARPGATERFLREARAVAAVHNEHIVTIYQVGQATVPGQSQGVPFLAQELLQGEPLDARLKREGQLPIGEAILIAKQMAEGLAAAHERGLIHRDIKPANVFLVCNQSSNPQRQQGSSAAGLSESHTGRTVGPNNDALADAAGYKGEIKAKLLDFGLARSLGNTENLTQSGMILGTPAYMAPEQARGELVDARADLFSLGCVLYRMLTGQQAFGGKDVMATLMSLATHEPPAPSSLRADVPDELSDLVMKLITKNRDARPVSAAVVMQMLSGMMDTSNRSSSPSNPQRQRGRIHKGDADSLADAAGYLSRGSAKRVGLALGAMALIALLAVVIVKIKTKDGKETDISINVPGAVDSATVSVRANAEKSAAEDRTRSKDPNREIAGILLKRGAVLVVKILSSKPASAESLREVPEDPKDSKTMPIGELVSLDASGKRGEKDLPAQPFVVQQVGLVAEHPLEDDTLVTLESLRSLTHVNFWGAPVTDQGMQRLARLTWLKGVALSDTPVTDNGLKSITAISGLTHLSVLGSTQTTAAGMSHLAELRNLEWLDWHRTATDDGLAHLENLKEIWHLDLGNSPINGSGLRHLKDHSKLRILFLGGASVDDANVHHWPDLPALEELTLHYSMIGDGAAKQLKRFKKLRVLGLEATRITNAGVADLAELSELSQLSFAVTQVTEVAFEQLVRAKSLWSFDIRGIRLSEVGAKHLVKIPSLRVLIISREGGLTDGARTILADELPNCRIVEN